MIEGGIGAWSGAIVRLRPTEWVDPETIDRVTKVFRDAGAIAVKVLPCPPKGEVVIAETKQPRRTLRQVVTAMVDEAKGVDTNALRDIVEQVMGDEEM